MVTKDDIRGLANGQDQIMSILKRLDEERIFTLEWVKRIEAYVAKIKEVLKIP